jgi:hypothetical protein
MLAELVEELTDLFDVFAVLLVFTTVLFGLRHEELNRLLEKELPAQTKANERLRGELRAGIWGKAVPFTLLSSLLAYLFLPMSVEIWSRSRLNLWEFNVIATAFFWIVVMLWGVATWGAWTVWRLYKRVRKAKAMIATPAVIDG